MKDSAISDGRRLRGVRSRQAIIDALIGLINEGILAPTAQQIADRAGVVIRTLFHHFSDMESLITAADAQKRESYEALFSGGDRGGDRATRIRKAVAHRADAYEATEKTILSSHAQRWRYDFLKKNYAGYSRWLRKDFDDWLPELKELDQIQREAVDAIASFEMWHRLREYQGLSKKMSIEVVVSLLTSLLDRA